MNIAGQYGNVPPPRGFSIHHVLAEPASHTERNRTPKQVAMITNADRAHGQRVYDAANALNLWKGIEEEAPCPSGPRDRFRRRRYRVGKRGLDIAQRSVDISHSAGRSQWRSHRRMRDRLSGQKSSREPLYQPYYGATGRYVERWRRTQQRLTAAKVVYGEDRKGRVQRDKEG